MNAWSEKPADRNNSPVCADPASPVAILPATGDAGLDAALAGSRAIFWRPRHLTPSPMLGQIPFLFWIMETVRPRSIAQIGLGDGLVYMALCQAAERLGGRTVLMGCQSASGDGAALLPHDLQQQHDAQYPDVSVLLPCDPRSCPVPDDLDMLVLHEPLPGDAGDLVERLWLPRLSERAVLLICRPQWGGVSAPVTLPQGLSGRPALRGPLSPGQGRLDVVLAGPRQPDRLEDLARGGDDGATRLALARLGKGIEDGFQLSRAHLALCAEREMLQSTRTHHEQRITELQQALKSAQDRLTQSEAAHSRDIVALQGLRDQVAGLERQHGERIDDIAVLMQDSQARQDELRKQAASLKSETGTLRTERDRLRSEAKALRAERDRLRALNERTVRDFQTSTSWRLTAPIRGIGKALRRK